MYTQNTVTHLAICCTPAGYPKSRSMEGWLKSCSEQGIITRTCQNLDSEA